MNHLCSPLAAPDAWGMQLVQFQVPPGCRYVGAATYALKATHASGAMVRAPLPAVVRSVAGAGPAVIELEVLPFHVRKAAQSLPFGLPVLYVQFDKGNLAPAASGGTVAAGGVLGDATEVTLCAVLPDGIVRDPLYWVAAIDQAFQAAGEDRADWPGFLGRLRVQAGAGAPVLVLDHCGAPLATGTFDVQAPGGPAQPVTLQPADHGDLRRAAARDNAAVPDGVTVAPAGGVAGADWQLACLETGAGTEATITVTGDQRHLLVTDLHTWFASQYAATATIPVQYHLPRYTRHNTLTSLVNGSEFFADIFGSLAAACGPGGGFHLTGWDMDPLQLFVPDAPAGADKEFRTLKKVAELVGTPGQVSSCFLPAKFINLKKATGQLSATEKAGVYATLAGFSLFFLTKTLGLEGFRTDGTGGIMLIAVLASLPLVATTLTADDAKALEPNSKAVDELDPPPGAVCCLAPYPATLADNWRADTSKFPLSTLANVIEQFNVYHQKFAVVRTAGAPPRYIGYCGGVDFNPNRMDDANHLNPQPFHDVHLRVEGPAVRDLALTFDHRWARDGQGGPAFAPPALDQLDQQGEFIAQVARTYFGPANPARGLPFAPEGDRTLLDTLLKAIAAARQFIYIEDQYFTPPDEYADALVKKVTEWAGAGARARVIIAIPAVTDQPFGQGFRDPFIQQLKTAGPGIVRVGFPRRRYTVPRCDLRASSGKLLLMDALHKGWNEVRLGPASRVPGPPFWLSVNGELMYAYDEAASTLSGVDPKAARAFVVDRGDSNHLLGTVPGTGPFLRDHPRGSAATLVELSGIYVHAKVMIVDDLFLSAGSANVNRRGFYSDGECNIFAVPEALKASPANPVAALRRRLWAEMLDLPSALVGPLLTDPVTASELFDRSYLLGNRFVPHDAVPADLMPMAFKGGDSVASMLLDALEFAVDATQFRTLFDGVVDPSSELEPRQGP